jgi:hypothetical protein
MTVTSQTDGLGTPLRGPALVAPVACVGAVPEATVPEAATEVVAEHVFVGRAEERRRQRGARLAVGAVLVGAAGLAVLALVTARTPPGQAGQPAGPPAASSTNAGPAVGTAGLAPSIEPPTLAPSGAAAVVAGATGSTAP